MSDVVLSVDASTSGVSCIAWDSTGTPLAMRSARVWRSGSPATRTPSVKFSFLRIYIL
jgi:hypothetical protein